MGFTDTIERKNIHQISLDLVVATMESLMLSGGKF